MSEEKKLLKPLISDHRTWMCQGCHWKKDQKVSGTCICELYRLAVFKEILNDEWCESYMTDDDFFKRFSSDWHRIPDKAYWIPLDLKRKYDEWRKRNGL